MLRAGFAAVIIAATGAALAVAQRSPSVPNGGADDMISNVMIPGFDANAGLRAAQASSDPANRVEIIRRPGTTKLERVAGRHRAQAVLTVQHLPAGFDPERWPATALIGGSGAGTDNHVVSGIELRVDGCLIAMPLPRAAGFTDPQSFELGGAGNAWTLTISNNGDSEAYTAVYKFDDKAVVAQRIGWAGSSTAARLNIDEDDSGADRDCIKVGRRTAGTRAELKADMKQ